MNSEGIFQLVRSGALFGAMSPDAARSLHVIRRYLNIDCPNTYEELIPTEDQSAARGQVLDPVLLAVMDNLRYPRIEHYLWNQSTNKAGGGLVPTDDEARSAVMFSVEEDAFFQRGCGLHTVARRIDYRFHSLPMETPEEAKRISGSNPTHVHRATGLKLNSLAMLQKSLSSNVRHRCSIQVMSHPQSVSGASVKSGIEHVTEATTDSSAVTKSSLMKSPYRSAQRSELQETSYSPSKMLAEEHYSGKAFTPHCCFGIYCPTLPEENLINQTLQHRSTFTSRRWLGVYWSDGTSVPTMGLIGTVTTGGVMRAVNFKGRATINVGDVITIETRPKDDDCTDGTAGLVLFFLNGNEVGRVTIDQTMPVATRLEDCYFAVRLSEGASVAAFVNHS